MTTVYFVIIGAGAAGGVVARELARAGFRVVVLEQGPYLTAKDFDHDEIEFTERSRKGPVASTGLDDWPITYADLEPGRLGDRGLRPRRSQAVRAASQPALSPAPRCRPSLPACSWNGRRGSWAGRPSPPRWPSSRNATGVGLPARSAASARRSAARWARSPARSPASSPRRTRPDVASPRPLLLSKSNRFPDGLANSRGMVGGP